MSIHSQLARERDELIESRAINIRMSKRAWTMREVAAQSTLRIDPKLSERRKNVLRGLNNRAAIHDPIRIEESKKVLDEWITEFNQRARKLGYDSLMIQPDDHLHVTKVRREIR